MKIKKLGLFLTSNCNFKCIYCCVQTGEDPPDKLNFCELKDILVQARSMGAKYLVIPGKGEPLLDVNFFPLIEYAQKIGMVCEVNTNMSLINKDIARWLFDRKVHITAKLNSLKDINPLSISEYYAYSQNSSAIF